MNVHIETCTCGAKPEHVIRNRWHRLQCACGRKTDLFGSLIAAVWKWNKNTWRDKDRLGVKRDTAEATQ